LFKCKDILNAAVIDSNKAEELGRVKEIIFDLNNRKALAIVVSNKNQPFTSLWIDFGYIKEFNDVILLNSNADIIPVSEIQDAKKNLKKILLKSFGVLGLLIILED